MPPRPPLDPEQTAAALNTYYAAREQAVRYVLAQLDPTAYNAPALPYDEVLAHVQDLLTAERGRYAEAARIAEEAKAAEVVRMAEEARVAKALAEAQAAEQAEEQPHA